LLKLNRYELFADIGEESRFRGVKLTRVNKVFDKVNKKMLFVAAK